MDYSFAVKYVEKSNKKLIKKKFQLEVKDIIKKIKSM